MPTELRCYPTNLWYKKRRLAIAELSGTVRITDSALAGSLKHVPSHPELLKHPPSRRTVDAAVLEFAESVHMYLELPLADGGTFNWFIARPQLCFAALLEHCEGFANVMRMKLAEHPNSYASPWHILIYADEAVPGSVLKPDNQRKSWCLLFYIHGAG